MPHQTTVVELSIEPAELFRTVQSWASASGFFVYGKSGNRTYYTKDILGAKGWVSVETGENTTRIEVWQSSSKVGPDFDGNLWVGWKMPLPPGPVIGPNGVYKKQVHTLFELLAGKTVDSPRQEINRQIKRRQPTLNLSVFTKGLMIFGVISLAMGILTLVSAFSLFSNVSLSGLVKPMLLDGTSDLILGTLTIASSRVMAKGRLLGIWLYAASVLMSYLYTVAVGEQLNVIFLGFSLLFIWQIFQSRQDLGLS